MISRIYKKIVRVITNNATSLIIISGFVVSFLMFQYYDTANRIIENEKDDKEKYRYSSTLYCYGYSDDLDINDLCEYNFDDNVAMIIDLNMFVGDMDMPRLTNVVLGDGKLKYPLISGHYPTEEQLKSGEPIACLGKKLKPYTYEKQGKDYIKINKEEYLVTGYVSTGNSGIYDFMPFLYYECLGDKAKKDLLFYKRILGINILFQSDSMNYNDLNEFVEPYIQMNQPYISISQNYEMFVASEAKDKDYKDMVIIIYIFSLMLVIMVVNYWYDINHHEYIVRRIFGYSTIQLAMRIIAKFFKYIVIAIVITEFSMYLIGIVENSIVENNILENPFANIGRHVALLGKYVIITLPVVAIVPVTKMIVSTPISNLRRKV